MSLGHGLAACTYAYAPSSRYMSVWYLRCQIRKLGYENM